MFMHMSTTMSMDMDMGICICIYMHMHMCMCGARGIWPGMAPLIHLKFDRPRCEALTAGG